LWALEGSAWLSFEGYANILDYPEPCTVRY
jgi:hypothetical protein